MCRCACNGEVLFKGLRITFYCQTEGIKGRKEKKGPIPSLSLVCVCVCVRVCVRGSQGGVGQEAHLYAFPLITGSAWQLPLHNGFASASRLQCIFPLGSSSRGQRQGGWMSICHHLPQHRNPCDPRTPKSPRSRSMLYESLWWSLTVEVVLTIDMFTKHNFASVSFLNNLHLNAKRC